MSLKKRLAIASTLTIIMVSSAFLVLYNKPVVAQSISSDGVLVSLQTATPEEGFALAITLARKGVTTTQPNKEVLHALRPNYAHDADSLIAASQVAAIHFQTIAAANNYWRK